MNYRSLYLLLTAGFLLMLSCSEERQPIFLSGSFDAVYFEAIDCQDSLDNISIDFTKDSTYIIDGDTIQFQEFNFNFQINTDMYTFEQRRIVNGVEETNVTSGLYLSSGFNDIVFCETDCQDSLWDFGLYVLTGSQLDLTWQDTLDAKCGYLFQGFRN